MQVLQNISLDFGRDTIPITVFAKQYDKESRIINITPLDRGKPCELESGITARLQLTKPDNHTVIDDATISGGIISVELSEQILIAHGTATAEIALYKGAALLSSQVFYIDIKKGAYNPDAPVSSDEYKALTKALENVSSTVESVKTSADNAEKAANAANDAKKKAEAAATTADEAGKSASQAVTTAQNAAQSAAQAATVAQNAAEAAAGADNLNITAEQTATGATISVTDRTGTKTELHLDTLMSINSWADVRNAVRLGLGEKLFPVGYEFTTLDADTGVNLVWAVRGHDHHIPANKHLTHSMTLELKYLYSNADGSYMPIQFDAPEALYGYDEELEPGTYKFTVAEAAASSENGKVFEFTLTQPLPEEGLIMLYGVTSTLTGKSIATYATHNDLIANTPIEISALVASNAESDAIDLGITDGQDRLNYLTRCIRGSNNYAQSAARQWLNSAAIAGSVWQPTTYYDTPPTWANELNGFMHGLPTEFLEVVVPVIIPCRTNSKYEIYNIDGTEFNPDEVYELEDKFFLLSRGEMYGIYDNDELQDGKLLDYYDGLTSAEKKKYDNGGTARSAWLRSPTPTNAYSERVVTSSTGNISSSTASDSNGVAPACIIG